MVQALIRFNGITGSNPPNGTPLVLGATVTVTNVGTGGELTYLWEFADKPEGSSASFASPTSANTTFATDVEGTYLVRLTVNRTLPSERVDTQVAAVLQKKTAQRIPAAGEALQANTTRGWAEAVNRLLKLVDTMRADPGIFVAGVQETINRGQVGYVYELDTINSGLPEEALIASMKKAHATTLAEINRPLFIAETDVGGNTGITVGELGKFRSKGVFGPVAGAPTVGDPVYLTDAAGVALTAGTISCQVGIVCHVSGGNYYFLFDGAGVGGSFGTTAPVLMDGAYPALVNGRNIQALSTGAKFAAALDVTPLKVQQFLDAGAAANVFEVIDKNEDVGLYVNAALELVFAAVGGYFMDGADLPVGTKSAHSILFQTNDIAKWEITSAGKLQSTGADRVITGLDAPVATKDATRKSYVDAQVPVLYFGNTAGALTEHALDPGYGARTSPVVAGAYPRMRAPRAGTLSKLYVHMETQPTGANIDYVVYVNGGATSLTVTTSNGGGSQDLADTTHSVSVALGDVITVHGKPAGVVTNAPVEITASLCFSG